MTPPLQPDPAEIARTLVRRGEPMTVDEIVPLLRPSEKKALLNLTSKCRTCKEIGTTGTMLWELNDFRRDLVGIAPPTCLVWYDEEYGWRGWALTPLGEAVRAIIEQEGRDARFSL